MKSLLLLLSLGGVLILMKPTDGKVAGELRLEEEYIITNEQEENGDVFPQIIEEEGIMYNLSEVYEECVGEREIEIFEDILTISLDPVLALADEDTFPVSYRGDGTDYYLKSSSYETTTISNRRIKTETTMEYTNIEAAEGIPLSIQTTVTDEETKKLEMVTLPLKNHSFDNHRWMDDFSFTVTFETYGSSYYTLGDKYIPYTEDVPALAGYERELLKEIGVSEDNYRITGYEWLGDTYVKDGIHYRDAKAYGERLVADCAAVYGGEVPLPDIEGYVYTLTYSTLNPEEPATYIEKQMKATGIYEIKAEPDSWEDSKPVAAAVTSMTSLILLAVIITTCFLLAKQGKKEGGYQRRIRKYRNMGK